MNRYFLKIEGLPEHEVTKEAWVAAEWAAGFRNTLGQPEEPATASWSSGPFSGRISYERIEPVVPPPAQLILLTEEEKSSALLEELARVRQAERYELSVEGTHIVIKVEFFKELITARCKLWALESAGVDNWDGYPEALAEPLGDDWLEELT